MEHRHQSPLQVEVSWAGVVATVTVTGELDLTTATHLTRCFLAVAARHPERLVLDLKGLVFVDVAGARTLHKVPMLLQSECPVNVRQPPPPSARRVFEVTGLMPLLMRAGRPIGLGDGRGLPPPTLADRRQKPHVY